MRTPAGFECKYFYGNYFRGRSNEECRLIGNSQSSPQLWTRDLCKICPVPAIQRANACPNLVLHADVSRSFFGLKKQVKISAYCEKSQRNVNEPEIGCGLCHPEINEFFENEQ